MSVEELLKLRDEVGRVLSQKAVQLQEQLSILRGEGSTGRRGPRSSLKRRKVAIKYRDKEGNTWAGRGAQPVWLREKLKAGAKLEDFAVDNASARKTKKRRRKKYQSAFFQADKGQLSRSVSVRRGLSYVFRPSLPHDVRFENPRALI